MSPTVVYTVPTGKRRERITRGPQECRQESRHHAPGRHAVPPYPAGRRPVGTARRRRQALRPRPEPLGADPPVRPLVRRRHRRGAEAARAAGRQMKRQTALYRWFRRPTGEIGRAHVWTTVTPLSPMTATG